tara:strand:- start:4364 stop:4549 length:186 start_codon:yes stop_codon:yes gene_type:complete
MRGKGKDKVSVMHKKKRGFEHAVVPADKKEPINKPSKIFEGFSVHKKTSPKKKEKIHRKKK